MLTGNKDLSEKQRIFDSIDGKTSESEERRSLAGSLVFLERPELAKTSSSILCW